MPRDEKPRKRSKRSESSGEKPPTIDRLEEYLHPWQIPVYWWLMEVSRQMEDRPFRRPRRIHPFILQITQLASPPREMPDA